MINLKAKLSLASCLALIVFNLSSTKTSAADFTGTFGPEEQVLKNTVHIIDSPYWSYKINGKWFGFLVSQYSSLQVAKTNNSNGSASLLAPGNNLTYTRINGLEPGNPDAFDGEGTWLWDMFTDKQGTLHGFYHAETKTPTSGPFKGDFKHDSWSIAYAKSTDGGLNWTKPNYPNNQILTARKGRGELGGRNWSVGQQWLTNGSKYFTGDNANYLYLLYGVKADIGYSDALARAPISSNGTPGSWKKYFCDSAGCDFKEPGIGGQETIFKGPTTFAYSTYLKKFIGIDGPGENHTSVWTSDDLINWQKTNLPTFGNQVNRQNYAYVSIVSLSGDSSEVGQEFYFYYAELLPPKVNLLRRKVTLSSTDIGQQLKRTDFQNLWFPFYTHKFGQTASRGKLDGDFNTDGKVDGLDYVRWFAVFAN